MNYYEMLGVDRNASSKEIKAAYLKLIWKWHPDRNKDNPKVAEEKTIEINNAYDTLKDEVARIDYNKKLDAEAKRKNLNPNPNLNRQRRQTNPRAKAPTGNINIEDLNKAFENMFGFDPKSKRITNEDMLNTFAKNKSKKNPLDTGALFERFWGFKV